MQLWGLRAQMIVAVAIVCGCCCCETFDNRYGTLAEAVRDGEIQRGWVPDFLPASTRNIREWHELDASIVYGRFECDKNEWALVVRSCTGVTEQAVKWPPANVADHLTWWSPQLVSGGQASQFSFVEFTLGGVCRAFLATRAEKQAIIGYYWTTGERLPVAR